MKNLILSFTLIISLTAVACPDGFVPENNLYIDTMDKDKNLTEQDFHTVIKEVSSIYEPIIASMGGKLVVESLWDNGTVNAYAKQKGSEWMVSMFGGLARHKHITRDGFALVVCHEIGHHVGGFPQYSGMDNKWASNEGQADYFSTAKCLRRYWDKADNAFAVYNLDIPQALIAGCQAAWKTPKDINLCLRTGMAGYSVAKLFADLNLSWWSFPKFEKPKTNVVKDTQDGHPHQQCRLDTYFQGSLCNVPYTTNVSRTDETIGSCHSSRGHSVGTRPLCWFKPSK